MCIFYIENWSKNWETDKEIFIDCWRDRKISRATFLLRSNIFLPENWNTFLNPESLAYTWLEPPGRQLNHRIMELESEVEEAKASSVMAPMAMAAASPSRSAGGKNGDVDRKMAEQSKFIFHLLLFRNILYLFRGYLNLKVIKRFMSVA